MNKWDILINATDCKIDGNTLVYVMSAKVQRLFLGHKHTLKLGYPEQIQVEGKKILTFDYVGMAATSHDYKCGKFLLKIKYN